MYFYRRYRWTLGSFLFCVAVVLLLHLFGVSFSSGRNGRTTARLGSPPPTLTACQAVDTLALPRDITTGPDGQLWFSETGSLGSISLRGHIGGMGMPNQISSPIGIATGADGRVWFTEDNNTIGRMTLPARTLDPIDALLATKIQEFPLPSPDRQPYQIVRGPDGNLWFTEQAGDAIGRITPAGKIREFKTPTRKSAPAGITAGPDGNLWFTEQHAGRIGRITPAGVITEFPLPAGARNPIRITTGHDGNLYFTADRGVDGTVIGRVTPAGHVTVVARTEIEENNAIISGPDGNLWLTGFGAILRVTPRGAITEYDLQHTGSSPYGITIGPDKNLWFTDPGAANIGRISPRGAIKLFPLCTG
jgi:virginiamycin B lyase